MGEFQDAVSHLLQAFAHGISIIKTQRGRRKRNKIPIDSTAKSAETHLSKTLQHNQEVVEDAYGKDLVRHGAEFAKGDAEAHSSLSSILLRLNAGFVSVIERFTRGLSTPSDYETLLSLSNSSRQEAIDTFSLLSQRLYLSRSSLALVPLDPNARPPHKQKRRKTPSSTKVTESSSTRHSRSKSVPELSMAVTPLGLATPEGWVRPKAGRKQSSDSNRSSASRTRSGVMTPKHIMPKPRSPIPSSAPIATIRESQSPSSPSHHKMTLRSQPHTQHHLHSAPPSYHSNQTSLPSNSSPASSPDTPGSAETPTIRQAQPTSPFQRNRKSIMSFASDSTKLGEIPEHKWARQGMLEAGNFPILAYYPMEPYRESEKPRSRLRKLFRR